MARKIKTPIAEAEALIREAEKELKNEDDKTLRDKWLSQKARALKIRNTAMADKAKQEAKLVDSDEWRKMSALIVETCCDGCKDKLIKLFTV